MSKVRPVLILLVTLAAMSALYYTQYLNSHKFAFGWKVGVLDALIALPEIFVVITVIRLLRSSENQSNSNDDIRGSYFGKGASTVALLVVSIIVVLFLLIWTVYLVSGYVGDEWGTPPSDEKSFPAPKGY